MNHNRKHVDKAERNQKIYKAALRDIPVSELAREFGLSRQRIDGIVKEMEAKVAKKARPCKLKLGKDYIRYKIRKLRII